MPHPISRTTIDRWSDYLDTAGARLKAERERLYETAGILASVVVLTKIVFGELLLGVAALPLYLFVPSRRAVKNSQKFPDKVYAYRLRRVFTLALVVLLVARSVGIRLWEGFKMSKRAVSPDEITYTWSFANPSALLSFAYDPDAIQIRGGVAVFSKGLRDAQNDTKTSRFCSTILEAREPFRLKTSDPITGFSAIASAGSGAVTYQISNDGGAVWWYAEDGEWKKSVSMAHFSSTEEIEQALPRFPRSSGREDALLFRARFENDCINSVELSSVSVKLRAAVSAKGLQITKKPEEESVPVSTIASIPAVLFSFKTSAYVPAPYNVTLKADPSSRSIIVSGHALAHAQVVVFADTPATAVYRAVADENGRWSIRHEQAYARLSTGRHVFYAVSRDPVSPFISAPSEGVAVDIFENEVPVIFTLFDTRSTLLTFFVLSIITFLVAYRRGVKNE